jgi:hypothetical protein
MSTATSLLLYFALVAAVIFFFLWRSAVVKKKALEKKLDEVYNMSFIRTSISGKNFEEYAKVVDLLSDYSVSVLADEIASYYATSIEKSGGTTFGVTTLMEISPNKWGIIKRQLFPKIDGNLAIKMAIEAMEAERLTVNEKEFVKNLAAEIIKYYIKPTSKYLQENINGCLEEVIAQKELNEEDQALLRAEVIKFTRSLKV